MVAPMASADVGTRVQALRKWSLTSEGGGGTERYVSIAAHAAEISSPKALLSLTCTAVSPLASLLRPKQGGSSGFKRTTRPGKPMSAAMI